MPTISEIQDYLSRTQKSEDKISDKSKDRVNRTMAEDVKRITPLKAGKCNLCSRDDDKLVPVTMKICMTCCNKFIKRGGEIRVIQKQVQEYVCDNCLIRTFVTFYVNPRVCQYCSRKIGNVHKRGHDQLKDQQRKIQQERERRDEK